VWVLKLGGSLLHAHRGASLKAARQQLFSCLRRSPARHLLVTGGGRYADAVRTEQASRGFDDAEAHLLALRAMDQTATELGIALGDAARVIARLDQVTAVLAGGQIPIWAPAEALARDPDLPQTWDLTSDSIAALAARRLNADGVCLLKSCAVTPGQSAEELSVLGITDRVWPNMVSGLPFSVLGPDRWEEAPGLCGATATASA